MDGRNQNKGTIGNKGGNPGAGKLHFVVTKVTKHQKEWWDKWKLMLDSDDKQERLEAMREFNKLQIKLIPQQVTGADGGPITIQVINYANIETTL